ncbi:MAG: DUF397 domain-containing protein [Pseudonocardiales bacterium]|nr:DUF397 domain-containing protein [Pseudonocardiales bacterium]MBV9652149.1 DUF397 domain-containing protein [Pseudonocardiales bacterium]
MRHLTWHKSSYSSDQGGNCLEVTDLKGHRAIRDSKDPTGSMLTFTPAQWAAFTPEYKPANSTDPLNRTSHDH